MYSNIGKKIKVLAVVIFIIEASLSVAGGLLFSLYNFINFLDCYYDEGYYIMMVFLGLLFAVVGPIISWLASWFVYGFGELIAKTCEIANNTRSETKKSKAQSKIDSGRVERLEVLRAQGIISESEYQQAISKF